MEEQAGRIVWAVDPVHSRIRFDVKYLLITSVSGWFREFEGFVTCHGNEFDNSAINLSIYTNSLYTGNDERDNHLRSPDFFDAAKYPVIKFSSTEVLVSGRDIGIKGILSIKDITQELQFTATYIGTTTDPMGNTKAGFEIDVMFNRKDFNITWNQFIDRQGLLLSDEVRVHCDVQLLKLP